MAATENAQDSANVPDLMSKFDAEDLRAIVTLQDAVRLLESGGIGIADATTEIGDGFVMLEDKSRLVKVPCLFLQWMFHPGDYGTEYLIARVIDEFGNKHVVTDGSTGLAAQVRDFQTRTGKTGGLMAPRGLRVSEYKMDAENNIVADDDPSAVSKGSTYYLNV